MEPPPRAHLRSSQPLGKGPKEEKEEKPIPDLSTNSKPALRRAKSGSSIKSEDKKAHDKERDEKREERRTHERKHSRQPSNRENARSPPSSRQGSVIRNDAPHLGPASRSSSARSFKLNEDHEQNNKERDDKRDEKRALRALERDNAALKLENEALKRKTDDQKRRITDLEQRLDEVQMALEHEMLMRQAAAETRAVLLASRAPSNPPSARSVSDTGSISSSANRLELPAIHPVDLALPREDSGESDSDAERRRRISKREALKGAPLAKSGSEPDVANGSPIPSSPHVPAAATASTAAAPNSTPAHSGSRPMERLTRIFSFRTLQAQRSARGAPSNGPPSPSSSAPHSTPQPAAATPSPPNTTSPRIEQKTPWTHVVSVNHATLTAALSSGQPLVIPGLTQDTASTALTNSNGSSSAFVPVSSAASGATSLPSPHVRVSQIDLASLVAAAPNSQSNSNLFASTNSMIASPPPVPSAPAQGVSPLAAASSATGLSAAITSAAEKQQQPPAAVVPPLALRQSPSLSAIQRKPNLKNASDALNALLEARMREPQLSRIVRAQAAKENYFGSPLESLVESTPLPAIITTLLPSINTAITTTPAILLDQPLVSAEVAVLRTRADTTGRIDVPSSSSPAVLAGLLRLWLQHLPAPLISADSLEALLEANDIPLLPLRQVSIRVLLSRIPRPFRPVFVELLRLLHNASESPNATQELKKSLMDSWSPLLLRSSNANASSLLSYIVCHFPTLSSLKSDMALKTEHKDGQLLIVAATQERLIDLALNPHYKEADFWSMFLLTYSYFASSLELFTHIRTAYERLIASASPWTTQWRKHLLLLLRAWLDQRRDELRSEPALFRLLEEFVTKTLTANKEDKATLDGLNLAIDLLRPHVSTAPPLSTSRIVLFSAKKSLAESTGVQLNLLGLAPTAIAAQITLVDFKLFQLIPEREFLRGSYATPETSPLFQQMVNRFNNWSSWAATQVLTKKATAERADMLAHLIRVCRHLLRLNNFSSSAAILYGLASPPVSRLRHTWERLPKKIEAEHRMQTDFFEVRKNYKTYREQLMRAAPPLIPHFGLVPRDLTAAEFTNATMVDGMINVRKLRLIHSLVSRLLRWQIIPFELESSRALMSFLVSSPLLSEDALYQASRELEPGSPGR